MYKTHLWSQFVTFICLRSMDTNNEWHDNDVSLTSLFHVCTGRMVAPLQLPDSQSFQPRHQTSTFVFKYKLV